MQLAVGKDRLRPTESFDRDETTSSETDETQETPRPEEGHRDDEQVHNVGSYEPHPLRSEVQLGYSNAKPANIK
jgi:hypothetical protein